MTTRSPFDLLIGIVNKQKLGWQKVTGLAVKVKKIPLSLGQVDSSKEQRKWQKKKQQEKK